MDAAKPKHEPVHVCHKCRWQFPNAHPSSRQRRAHKKICGTIEGYKLAVSNGSADERHSQEDQKTPSPRVMEKNINEKGSGVIRERSNKSEDELFADAATEFSETSAFSPGVEVDVKKSPSNKEGVLKDDSGSNQFVNDSAITDGAARDFGEVVTEVIGQDSESRGEISETNPKFEDVNAMSAEGVLFQSKEESVEDLNHNISTSGSLAETGSVKQSNASFDSAQTNMNVTQATEGCDGKEVGESAHILSMPNDVLVLAHPQVILEDCKDHERVKLDRLIPLDSCEGIEDDLKRPVSEEGSSSSQSKQLAEGAAVSCSVMPVSEDKLDDGSCKTAVKEGEVSLPEVAITFEKINQSDEVGIVEMERSLRTEDDGISKNLLQMCFPDVHFVNSSNEAKANESTNSVGVAEAGDYEKSVNENCDIVGTEISRGDVENSIQNIGKAHESSSTSFGFQVDSLIYSSEDNNAGTQEPLNSENFYISMEGSSGGLIKENLSIRTKSVPAFSSDEGRYGGPVEENVSIMTKPVPDFFINLDEYQLAAKDVTDGSNDKVPDIRYTPSGTVSESSRHGTVVPNIQGGTDETINGSATIQMENVDGVCMPTESSHGKDIELLHKVTEHHIMKEQLISPAVEEKDFGEIGGVTRTIGTSEALQAEADNNIPKQNFAVADLSIDSCSQTDSLDAHWGSVSVISTQSTAIDAESFPSTDSIAPANASLKNLKVDKSDPPSFLTVVEKGAATGQKVNCSDQNVEQQSMQAGWFPSLTNVLNESPGRKKNEEIIAKVTNWSSQGTGIPLKSFISQETKLPIENPSQAQMVQKDYTAAKGNGSETATVNSILGTESRAGQATQEKIAKEWNSPARYPSEIKGGKRKAKGKPIWAQFVCCSSVN